MKPVDTIKAAILAGTDWDALYRRLEVYAFWLASGMPAVFDGVSADDLPGETLLAFWTDPASLNWDPTIQPSLEKFLGGVLKNKFLTHRRRSQTREHPAPSDRNEPMLPVLNAAPPQDMLHERIRDAVRGARDLEEFIEASQKIEDGANVNQLLSQELHTTVEDVVNRKKRIKTRLKATLQAGRNCVHMQPRVLL
ncbi:MAG: hypothetical protein WA830_03415 [Candidatus Sulfotelmatobacter sp.]